jgi:adenylate cyclase
VEPTPRLVPIDDDDNAAQREVSLVGDAITLGRAANNAIVLDDDQVSKNHALLRRNGDGWVLEDLKSSNGTFVNGDRIRRHVLEQGDVIELGACRFTFEADSRPGGFPIKMVTPRRADHTNIVATRATQEFAPGEFLVNTGELRAGYDGLRVAFDAVQRLASSTDVGEVCRELLEVVFELVEPDSGVVLLADANGALKSAAARATTEGTRVVVSRTIVERCIKERSAVLATDAAFDERFANSASIVRAKMRSVMCVPLMTRERVHGVLHVSCASRVSAFGQEQLDLLTGIGVGASVAVEGALLRRRLDEESRTRESLGRFLSPVLVEQVMRKAVQLTRGGKEAEVTVLFADIRGFTAFTEQRAASEVVGLLNEYFDQMVEVVFRHQGVLDKFMGDALMAVWGTPVTHSEDAARALAAAREMQQTVASLNELRQDRGDDPIQVGIGLSSGPCVAGTIGARRRMEYTVIGDCVNLASRLCGMAKPGQIIFDGETFDRAGKPEQAERLAPQKVKGKTLPVLIYAAR